MKKRITKLLLFSLTAFLIVVLCFTNIKKVNAFSMGYSLSSSTQSHLLWGLADTSLHQNPSNTTTEYKLISLQKNNYNDNDIVKIKNYFSDGDPEDPYEIKIRTYALTTSVYFNPSAGYLGFFYDRPNTKIYILTLQCSHLIYF